MAIDRPTSLETPRLLLRPFCASDLQAYRAIRAKPGLHTYMPGGEAGAKEADEKARTLVAAWSEAAWRAGNHPYAPWAVIDKATAKLGGHLGLRFVEEIGETEILYLLDDGFQGKGLATEGGHAALAFARTVVHLKRVVAFALPANARSLCVMERIGMELVGPCRVFGLDTLQYRIDLSSD
ncbi:MAG: GNAT family N-acetyltransferase [Paracoccaceae bacterium]|nr:GNAT family N-acetyltransferase [Paracoccaceae bacterium]